MSAPAVIDLAAKLATFDDRWNPRIVGRYNGNELRVVKVAGEFTWHAHAGTDELFMVLHGELGIEFRDGVRTVRTGECVVVPQGTEHRPFATVEAHVLILDREGESNTGDAPSAMTRAALETI